MDRREFLHTTATAASTTAACSLIASRFSESAGAMSAGAGALAAPSHASQTALSAENVLNQHYPFVLPPLGYANSAVKPAVDALTLSIHHDRHHAAQVAISTAPFPVNPRCKQNRFVNC